MAFSLKKLVEGAAAQVIPFDGGKTFATVQRGIQPAPPRATTPAPGAPSNIFQKAYETLTPLNETAIRRNNASMVASNNKINSLGNRSRGVLSDPLARDAFKRATTPTNVSPSLQVDQVKSAVKDTFTNPTSFDNAPKVNIGSWKGSGLAEDFINSPFKVAKGRVQIGQGQYKQGAGNIISGALEGPLGLLPPTKVAQAATKGATLGARVAASAKPAAIEGAALGTAYGASDAAARDGSAKDIIKGGVIGGVLGAAGGGTIGAAAPVARAGASKTIQAARDKKLIAPSRLNGTELASLTNYRNTMGTPALDDATYQAGRQAAERAGLRHTDVDAIDNLLLAQRSYEVAQAQRPNLRTNEVGSVPSDSPVVLGAGKISRPVPTEQPMVQPAAPPVVPPNRTRLLSPSANNDVPAPRVQTGLLPPDRNIVSTASSLDTPQPQRQTRYASQTVPNSEFVSDAVGQEVRRNAPTYSIETEQARYRQALGTLNTEGEDAFTQRVYAGLQRPNGQVSSQEVADAQTLAQLLDARGDASSLQRATDIYEKLSEHLTAAGQTVQAAAILARRTPEGLQYGAIKSLKQAGVDITPQLQAQLKSLIDVVRRNNSPEARYAVTRLVSDNIPTSTPEKIINFWRAGLLTAPTTTAGNILGNSGEALVRKGYVNPVATAVDSLFSLKTGKRTQTLGGGFTKGAEEGISKLPSYMKTGFDERNAMTKYDTRELNYGKGSLGKAASAYVNGVYRLMSVADQPYWYGARNEALSSIAKSEAINGGIPRNQRKQWVKQFVSNPPEEALERATTEANYATFQNKTALGDFIAGGKTTLNQKSATGKAIVDFIAPFTQVPSSIATRIITRTPIGTAQEITKQIASKQFDQRAMSQAIAEGTFGPTILGAGYALANSGLLTFAYPKDEKERKLWEAEGKQPYSIKLDVDGKGDRWYSLNYLQPFGTLLAIGGQTANDVKKGTDPVSAVGNGFGAAGQAVLNQSFLKGVSGILSALSDPEANVKKTINNTASGLVPNVIRSAARASDDTQRDEKGVLAGIKQGIPGLRQTTDAKLDLFGKPLPAKDTFLNQYINPFKPSKAHATDPAINELRRLVDIDKGILPSSAEANTFAPKGADSQTKEQYKLKHDQLNQLNAQAGQAMYNEYLKIVKNPNYARLSDEDKVKSLKTINETIYGAIRKQYGAKLGLLDQKATKLDSRQNLYASGGNVNYIKSSSPSGSKETPKERYDTAVADFEASKDSYSAVGRRKKEKELAKLKFNSSFDNDTIDLYGMSKKDVEDFITTDPDGNRYAQQLLAYGDALQQAGLGDNKFRNKNGAEAFITKKSTGKRSSGARKKGRGTASKQYGPRIGTLTRRSTRTQGALRKLLQSAQA